MLLTDDVVGGQTMNRCYYTLLIERLRNAILEKCGENINNGVLLLHDNAPVHRSNFVQAAIRRTGLVEWNHPAFSSGQEF